MRVTFIDSDGEQRTVDGEEGESVMRCATRHLVVGIVGECGGAMACATCHGYVDEAWAAALPGTTAQEQAMLAGCLDVSPDSRLTCQVRLTQALDGLTIRLPRSQV